MTDHVHRYVLEGSALATDGVCACGEERSGGGAAYAERWRDIAFPSGLYYHASKDTRLPDAGDITVDDADLKTRADLLTPQEFVTFMEAGGKATAVKWSTE